MNNCPKCAEGDHIITLLSYAVKDAREQGYVPEEVVSVFVDDWLARVHHITIKQIREQLRVQQMKADRATPRKSWGEWLRSFLL